MCGIIMCKGREDAVNVVLEGLKSLEYRGYDSYGIAAEDNSSFFVHKQVGKIGEVNACDLKLPKTTLAMGHTRWATHGNVTSENSHPHLSNDKKIAAVHNGIIENYQELREKLEEKGHRFVSATDTEVVPMHIQYLMDNGKGFKEAVVDTLNEIEGSFALVILNAENREIAVARRGSPLVLGLNDKNEFFAASDVPAFLEHTNNVIYMDDDEYGFIGDKIEIFSLKTGKALDNKIEKISWTVEQAKKGSFPHFMIKEISEQKFSINNAGKQTTESLNEIIKMIKEAKNVYLIGCGTSYHACLNGAYYFSKIAGKQVIPFLASEYLINERFFDKDSLIISLSQSGETADTIDAIKAAKLKGAKTVAIVNVIGSTISRISDKTMMMNAGPEICVLSTKSYTAQIAILMLLAFSLAGKEEEGKKTIEEASRNIGGLIDSNIKEMKLLALKLKDSSDIYLIGRNMMFPSSLEGALKIKEVSYIHAEGFAGAELKHGTIALVNEGTPAIAFSDDETRQLILSNATEIKSRGGFIIGVDSKENKAYDVLIKIPESEHAAPLYAIVTIQILAYYLALERGCDPDKPRNLAKSVTVR